MAMVFELLEEDVEDVEKYLSEMDEAYVSRMIAEMYSDNAVDVLKQVGEEMSALIYAWCHIKRQVNSVNY